jgi:hypothetical protein
MLNTGNKRITGFAQSHYEKAKAEKEFSDKMRKLMKNVCGDNHYLNKGFDTSSKVELGKESK